MPSDAYWQIISDKAARESFKTSGPFGSTLHSAESNPGDSVPDIFAYAAEHRTEFLKLLEILTPEKRDIAVECIVLEKTEKQIATLHGRKSQSMMGREITAIVKVLGAAALLGAHPRQESLAAIYASEGLAIPQGRKELRAAQRKLAKSKSLRSVACAEYLNNQLCQPTASATARLRSLQGRAFKDPEILGWFEVEFDDKNIGSLFTPRARQVSNASQI